MNLHNLFENQDQGSFRIGDPVVITGNVQFKGKTGDVREIGRDGAFVVVDLYNYGPRSFHSTDVSYNDYADSDDEQEYQQGVAEGYKFKGGFPFDVDHMPGAVHRNADMITDNVKTNDKTHWARAVDSINARVFDDMSEFRTDRHGKTVTGNGAVWAKWDNATQTGWFNAKGRPLRTWAIKEQGVAEEVEDTRRQVNLKKKIDKGTATPEQKKEYEALKAKNTGKKPGVAEGSGDISSMIQQYEDMVELVYDLPPGRKKNIAIDRRDALEAQIEAMPGGKEALRQWAKSYNDAMDEGVSEASDISGLIAAASMVRDYIVTAEVDGQTKRFRVRGMTGPTAARERFLKHASQARVIDVEPAAEKNVAEDAVADFLARGGAIQTGKYHRPRKSEKTDYGSRHIGGQRDAVAGKAGKTLGRAAATAFKGSGKPIVGEKAETNNEQPWVDPKLKRKMDYAFGHYAGYRDKPEAFFKWVMNSLEHSEENDQQHDRRFDRIEREIDQLSQRLKQVNEQHGAAVADRFSQRLAERFAADRPTADPARQLFAESRSQKRAAIREIFANQG